MGTCSSKSNKRKKVEKTTTRQTRSSASQRQDPAAKTQPKTKMVDTKLKPEAKVCTNGAGNHKNMAHSKASEKQKLLEKSMSDKGEARVNCETSTKTAKYADLVKGDVPEKDKNDEATQIVTTEAVAVDEEFNFVGVNQKERMRALKSKFREFDKNGDGLITKKEFIANWKASPIDGLNGEELFKEIDTNSSGSVSLSEFSAWFLKKAWGAIFNAFKKMDKRNDLKIQMQDFLKACNSNFLCPVSEAKKLFKKLDVNGDGWLSFEEFRDGTENHYILRTLQDFGKTKGAKGKVSKKKRKGNRAHAKINKFHLIYVNGCAKLNDSSIMEAFNQIDWKQTNRKLSTKEFVSYFGMQGVSKADSEAIFQTFDVNGNSFITFKEFKNYLTKPQWQTVS